MKGILYGIGVGPGEPEYLTLKGYQVLQRVQAVVVPVKGHGHTSTAYEIVWEYVPPATARLEQVYPMSYDPTVLEKAWAGNGAEIELFLARGDHVAFLTLGDPSVYSTYSYVREKLAQRGFQTVTVPGITSFQAAAAHLGFPLTQGNEKLALLTGSERKDELTEVIRLFDTVVILKVNRVWPWIYSCLAERNRLEGACLIQNLGLPGEKVARLADGVDPAMSLPYFSMLIIRKGCE